MFSNLVYYCFPVSVKMSVFKEMYKLAKEKNASRGFIATYILEKGFFVALYGYLAAERTDNTRYVVIFKEECDKLSKAASIITKVYGPNHEDHMYWKKANANPKGFQPDFDQGAEKRTRYVIRELLGIE